MNPDIERGVAPTIMVQVIAPSTLPGGYKFEAQMNGQVFLATVPPGGVKQGQPFMTEFPNNQAASQDTPTPTPMTASVSTTPMSNWKDGLCSCCRFGLFHPSLCLSFWCRAMALGQVLKRLGLTWCGSEAMAGARPPNPFMIMTIITVVNIVVQVVIMIAVGATGQSTEYTTYYNYYDGYYYVYATEETSFLGLLGLLSNLIFIFFVVVVMMRARSYIRQKYFIPEKNCIGCEDCCCAFWCSCCTVSQMARQTTNYELYSARCCSDTGLPQNVQVKETVSMVQAPTAGVPAAP